MNVPSVPGVLGIAFPGKATVDALTPDVTETKPLERRVDTVLRIGPSDGDDFLLAIESQSARSADKESSWAYYVAYLQSKYRLPVLLLVVCQDRATAKWATGPFDCGARGWTTQRTYPMVIGPDNLPVITDARTAADNLAMAAFSALAHARSPQIDAILEAMGHALQERDGRAADYVYEFLEINLRGTPAGDKWREILSFVTYFPGRGTVRETAYLEGKLEGKAEGEAKGILYVLEARGIPIHDDLRERITTCTDLDRLDLWLERSRTVTKAEELFTEGPENDPAA
ncbi:hypothetical protein [Streptomyces sporangiiformans]|uniref:Uncharacterized protein n=1 Tax=Streptomyces sporangiiformans TaxID=2315329 RepID=A0A505DE37_9ACTN|nr:hypothetical protein [Streptomyces sporangiiformans]TPQ17486.1 hypothetical protein FGD71_036180 [Streptomyces sporangiiformans]